VTEHTRVRILAASAALAVSLVGITKSKAQSPHATTASPLQSSGSTVPKTAEEQFKNIQVLKGIAADELIPTMQFITASLGVECEFCHVPKAFDKDDKKPKQTARKMMEMMFAINRDNFEGHRGVTCYSCHRGNADPVAIPAVMTEDVPANQAHRPEENAKEKEATAHSLPAPDQLLDKYLQALGGANAIDKITTRVMKGNIQFGGKSLPIEIYCKSPEQRISFMRNPEGDSVTAFNGHEGWIQNPKGPLHEMHGNELDGASIDADLHLPAHLKKMFTELRVSGKEKIGDHDTYDLIGRREGKTPIRLYFDQQSGLLVRLIRYGDTALGWLPTQIDYDDYREADGVKVPYRWTLARPSGRFTIQISELHENVPVDEAKFVKPAAPPQPPPPTK
jgi:photosynthetic reaction center cytochrome c subunit